MFTNKLDLSAHVLKDYYKYSLATTLIYILFPVSRDVHFVERMMCFLLIYNCQSISGPKLLKKSISSEGHRTFL